VIGAPVWAAATSGLKQNSVPPPAHVASVIVMLMADALAASRAKLARAAVENAATRPMALAMVPRGFSTCSPAA
jgi:hypothetical protein